MISEPYRVQCRIAARPDGSRVLVHKSQVPPRAAIFLKGSFNLLKIESLCNEDCAVGLYSHQSESFLIASVYLDINKPTVPGWLEEVCRYARSRQLPLILGMDSNSHSVLFGETTNKRGEELESFILSSGLMVENIGTEPTYNAHRSDMDIATCIDVM